jgi:thiol-disulfide isomerase/thioredoxin
MDKRQELYKNSFNKGLKFTDYLDTGTEIQKEKWENYSKVTKISDAQIYEIKEFKREMNIFCLSGIWCGDCMRQGPILEKIAKESSKINLHFFENEAFSEIRDEVRIIGGTRVPVIIICSEDFLEVTRFGDRTLSTYERKAKRELGNACDAGLVPPKEEEMLKESTEWFNVIKRAQLMLRLSPSLREKHND